MRSRSMNSSFAVDVATDCPERGLDLDLSRADFRRRSRSFASNARSLSCSCSSANFSACSLMATSAAWSPGTCCVSSPSSCSLSALACCNLRSPSLTASVAVCSLVLAFSTFACAPWTAFCSFLDRRVGSLHARQCRVALCSWRRASARFAGICPIVAASDAASSVSWSSVIVRPMASSAFSLSLEGTSSSMTIVRSPL